jgi:hypothetical protein
MRNCTMLMALGLLITPGCALMGSAISEPTITPMPNNAFEISMRGGVMTQRESLQSEWIKVAGKQCADYTVVSRDFATQYDMPTLSGIIKCKNKHSSKSGLVTTPSQPETQPKAQPVARREENKYERKTISPNTASSSASMIISQPKTKLRKKPSYKSDVVKNIKKGEVVQVIKQRDEWYLVELPGGETGWCQKSSLSVKTP